MKLVIAIVQKEDTNKLQHAFIENNIRATKLSTTGGFLSQGNTTFLIGTPNDEVNEVLDVIKKQSKAREELVQPNLIPTGMELNPSVKVTVGGATCFVVNVDEFKRF